MLLILFLVAQIIFLFIGIRAIINSCGRYGSYNCPFFWSSYENDNKEFKKAHDRKEKDYCHVCRYKDTCGLIDI